MRKELKVADLTIADGIRGSLPASEQENKKSTSPTDNFDNNSNSIINHHDNFANHHDNNKLDNVDKNDNNHHHDNLVGGIPTPLKNMSSSVGMMKFPTEMESHKIHVPNHQPVSYY